MITKERLAEIKEALSFVPQSLGTNITIELRVYDDFIDTVETLLRENERLSGTTNFCTQCEAYARENEALRHVAKLAEEAEEVGYWKRKDLHEALQALRGKEIK